ncbi:MAG: hypothetical protein R3E79_08810 [Caldilineaceae bacterium]
MASQSTTDHQTIRQWAAARGGIPTVINGTKEDGAGEGVLRIHFPAQSRDNASFREISWEEFFDDFEANDLQLVYQEKTSDGQLSRFNKLVERES